jgi:hypothetical protein
MSVTEPGPAQQSQSAQPQATYQPAPLQPGRIGTCTAPGKQILLTIVTFGIMAYVWTYRQHEEIKAFSGEGLGGGLGILTCMVGLTPFLLSGEVDKNLYQRTGGPSPVSVTTGFYCFIPFVGSILWYLKCQRAINDFWVGLGAQPAT